MPKYPKAGDKFGIMKDHGTHQGSNPVSRVIGVDHDNAYGVITFIDSGWVSFYLWPMGLGAMWPGKIELAKFGLFFDL
jgi:hypothetical protein